MLRRRVVVILAPVLIITGAALVYANYSAAKSEPRYEVTRRLSTDPFRGLAATSLEQFAILVNEGQVGRDAEEALPAGVDADVTASALPDLGVVDVKAVADTPEHAVDAAAIYGDGLMSFTTGQDADAYAEQLDSHTADVQRASEALDLAELAVSFAPGESRALAQRDIALNQYSTAISDLEAFASQGVPDPQLVVLSEGRVVDLPLEGFAGIPFLRQLAAAAVVGLVVGFAIAFLFEAIDRRLEGPGATSHAFGVPVLAEVPYAGKAFANATDIAPPASMLMESYRRLRTIVQLEHDTSVTRTEDAAVILIVSGSPAEGKTVTAAHLAVALSETGDRVLLISADFRRPALHRYFGLESTGGLDTLVSEELLPEELVKSTTYPGVSLITAGKGTHEPADLILHAQRIISGARTLCDYVIIDTSPLLSANDALDLVKWSDLLLVVSRARKTTTPAAHRLRDMLFQIDAPVLGVVSTGVSESEGYYYAADYGPNDEPVNAHVLGGDRIPPG